MRARLAWLAVPLVGLGLGCLGGVERTYFDDLVDASGPSDASALTTPDVTSTGDEVAVDDDSGQPVPDAGPVFEASTPPPEDVDCGPTNTPANCSACGLACDTTESMGASCNGVSCSYSGCAPGWGDCVTAAPNTGGCETRLNTTANCTGCGLACDSTNSTGASCNGTTCSYTGCRSGYDDCNKTAPDTDGCESPLNTTANCSKCGATCDTVHSMGATCSGTTCMYTGCAAGWSMCNTAAPNAGGCACHTPGCCSSACQTTHSDGMGQSFYDCNPLSTWNQTTALEACAAFTGNASYCSNDWTDDDPDHGTAVCSKGSPVTCACWSYTGKNIGLAYNYGTANKCYLPDAPGEADYSASLPWN